MNAINFAGLQRSFEIEVQRKQREECRGRRVCKHEGSTQILDLSGEMGRGREEGGRRKEDDEREDAREGRVNASIAQSMEGRRGGLLRGGSKQRTEEWSRTSEGYTRMHTRSRRHNDKDNNTDVGLKREKSNQFFLKARKDFALFFNLLLPSIPPPSFHHPSILPHSFHHPFIPPPSFHHHPSIIL